MTTTAAYAPKMRHPATICRITEQARDPSLPTDNLKAEGFGFSNSRLQQEMPKTGFVMWLPLKLQGFSLLPLQQWYLHCDLLAILGIVEHHSFFSHRWTLNCVTHPIQNSVYWCYSVFCFNSKFVTKRRWFGSTFEAVASLAVSLK